MITRAKIKKIVWVQGERWLCVALKIDPDKTVGLGVREWAQQDTLDNAENGAVRADAQCHGEYDHSSKSWGSSKDTNCVSKIVPHVFDMIGSSHITAFLLNLSKSSEPAN